MSEANCEDLILDAIDQLRKRKARPDLERICHMLERRHGVKSANVTDELSKLVRKGVVIKVDYKGSTSYRNAAKWARIKTHFFGSFYNSSDISAVVLEAVRSLAIPSKDQTSFKSASIHDIEQYLLKRDAQSNLNIATLQAVLEKEVSRKTIHRLPSGEFVPIVQCMSSDDAVTPEKNSSNRSSRKSSPLTPRKSMVGDIDDDDDDLDFDWSDSLRCDYCLLTSASNRKGEPELLLRCRECNAKAHPSCMEYTLPEEKSVHDIYWKCPDCKTCAKCNGTCPGNFDELLTCEVCHTDYHMTCHEPSVLEKPMESWCCSKCEAKSGRFKFVNKCPKFSLEEDSDVIVLQSAFLKTIEQYPCSVPYAHEWTIDNVAAFFKFIGFEEEAQAFRDQEIDGLSLLLMKRDDVLIGLGIKLGPALKIYNHIQRLQSKV